LFYLEESIKDSSEQGKVIARQIQFVEMTRDGGALPAGLASFLDYAPLEAELRPLVEPTLKEN